MSHVEKHCEVCGDAFSVKPSRANKAKTCGRVCRGKLIARRYEQARAKLTCFECGEQFSTPQCHADRRVYCSMECADKHRNDNPVTGEEHYNWKGGRYIHSDGYIYVQVPEHPYAGKSGYVFEHRLVMEDALRRADPEHHFLVRHGDRQYLSPDIHVHHVDEDKQNNAIGNLLACTPGAHANIHGGIAPMEGHVWPPIKGMRPAEPYRVERECETCGKAFEVKRSVAKKGFGRFCSRACYDARDRGALVIEFAPLLAAKEGI